MLILVVYINNYYVLVFDIVIINIGDSFYYSIGVFMVLLLGICIYNCD